MTSWQDRLLANFQPPGPRLTLVADPDGLLQDESVLAVLHNWSFEVLAFGDPVAFRFAYETQFRALWDERQVTVPALVVRLTAQDLALLPADLLASGRQLKLSLHDLFPNLSYPIVREFYRSAPALLDRLAEACHELGDSHLSDGATLAFIARAVYGLDAGRASDPNDLVECILQIHYHGWPVMESPPRWLDAQLAGHAIFRSVPAGRWLADRAEFFAFLEGEWQAHCRAQGMELGERAEAYRVGPEVDFSRPGIRVWVDTLFLEGRLRPVRVIAERPPADWMAVGVELDSEAFRQRRLEQLLAHVEPQLPTVQDSHYVWLEFAASWADVQISLAQIRHPGEAATTWARVAQELDGRFAAWLQTRYDSLHQLPFLPQPIIGHHIPHVLAAWRRDRGHRVALVIADGLALDQWCVIRHEWRAQGRSWWFDERCLFACLPTITSTARQSLAAGRPPLFFADTWQRTDVDGRRWRQFWEEQDLRPSAVVWCSSSAELDTALADERVVVVGLVLVSVDEMVHGTAQGLGELHDRVRRWAGQGEFPRGIQRLLAGGFDVWLTSDHGNVSAEGEGQPQEGVLVDRRGARVCIYGDPAFLSRARAEVPASLDWTPGGLPGSVCTLFAAGRSAFARPGQQLITHGGLTLEEVIVPWIRIKTDEG